MEQNVALTWEWMNVLEARSAHAILANTEYDCNGVLVHEAPDSQQTWMAGTPGMPPSAVPRFRDVLNRGFPLSGRWVFLDEIVAPPDSAHGTVPVACMVYWDQSLAGWRRLTAVLD